MPTELMPVTNVLFLPSGPNLRIEPWLLASVDAPSETKRFPSLSKHRPSGYFNPVAKMLFVPSGVNLKIECLFGSATYRLAAPSKASPAAWALMENEIVPKLATVRAINFLCTNVIRSPPSVHSARCTESMM